MPASTSLLIVTAGPARGRSLPLHDTVTIGRDDGNALSVPDPALSRRHCVIEAAHGRLVIRDLESRNGVFVNGCPIGERTLADGDQIRIGDSALIVVIPHGDLPLVQSRVTVDDAPLSVGSTVAIATAPGRFTKRPDGGDRTPGDARELALLLRVSEDLHAASTLDAFSGAVLGSAIDAVAAGSAALLGRGEDGVWRVTSADSEKRAVLSVHTPLADRTVIDRVAALAEDGSAICVPVDAETVLWLAAPTDGRLSEEQLQVAAALGAIAGLALERVRHLQWLREENTRLQRASLRHDLIGESRAMQAVCRFIERVAATDTTVLLRGESGTGKELIARAIHAGGSRASGPFVAINCAALPEPLLESELFGHERGAFTGAVSQQRGRLELANAGTVFLDEIGELAPTLQAKLLRVLQDRVIERVGGRRRIELDVRVIAATNRNLEAAMANGGFRQDLFYRLNVVALEMPPLRNRREDIPLLASFFVKEHAARCKRTVRGIAAEARTLLLRYEWPGNVRELSNVIERAVVLGASDVITPEDLPESLLESSNDEHTGRGFHHHIAAHKRQVIRAALQRHGGNVAAAARELELQVTYLHRLIRILHVRDATR
jgi:Nif-specific regulatory protein